MDRGSVTGYHLKVNEGREEVRAGEHIIPARWRRGVPSLTGGFGNGLIVSISMGANVDKVPRVQEVFEFGDVPDIGIDIPHDQHRPLGLRSDLKLDSLENFIGPGSMYLALMSPGVAIDIENKDTFATFIGAD